MNINTLRLLFSIILIILPLSLFAQPGSQKTIFEYAAAGNVSEVSAMIEQIGTADIYDSEGRGLLHYAAFSGQRDMIRYLTGLNLSIHTLDRGGLAPIHYAITNGMLDMVFQLVRLGGYAVQLWICVVRLFCSLFIWIELMSCICYYLRALILVIHVGAELHQCMWPQLSGE